MSKYCVELEPIEYYFLEMKEVLDLVGIIREFTITIL